MLLSFVSLLGIALVFPLRELGVVGDPSTSIVDVPALAETVRVTLAPLIASADHVERSPPRQLPCALQSEGHAVTASFEQSEP